MTSFSDLWSDDMQVLLCACLPKKKKVACEDSEKGRREKKVPLCRTEET
jgi:hypothetical protein